MKDNLYNEDQEFENMLRDKMNKLSNSVNCFDKISERAFSGNGENFSDNDFVVTDLENVTGKRRISPLLKLSAVGAAALFAIAVLPKFQFINKFLSDIGKTPESAEYRSVINSIETAVSGENSDKFRMYDIPLEEYIQKDVLITPLFSCPFEDSGKPDTRVRLFIRASGNILTNEVYAVEYNGIYSNENIIAAAKSKASFTEGEISNVTNELENTFISQDVFAESVVFPFTNEGVVKDKDGNIVSAASFVQQTIFKNGNDVFPLVSCIFYSHKDCSDPESYTFSLSSVKSENSTFEEYTVTRDFSAWELSLYRSGASAMPKENGSMFTQVKSNSELSEYLSDSTKSKYGSTVVFHSDPNGREFSFHDPSEETDSIVFHIQSSDSGNFNFSYIEPCANSNEDVSEYLRLHKKDNETDCIVASIHTPIDRALRTTLHFYANTSFLYVSSHSDPHLSLESDGPSDSKEYRMKDFVSIYATDTDISAFYNNNDKDSIIKTAKQIADEIANQQETLKKKSEEEKAEKQENASKKAEENTKSTE